MTQRDMFTQRYWDDRYAGHRHVWSGRPNPYLLTEAGDLAPGRAIDVGCGEGADAIWLAGQGWEVTGADVSPVGLERAAANAEAAGAEIAQRITWRQVDLFADEWTPLGSYELVTSQYLHLPPEVRGSVDAAPGARPWPPAATCSSPRITRPTSRSRGCAPTSPSCSAPPTSWPRSWTPRPGRS